MTQLEDGKESSSLNNENYKNKKRFKFLKDDEKVTNLISSQNEFKYSQNFSPKCENPSAYRNKEFRKQTNEEWVNKNPTNYFNHKKPSPIHKYKFLGDHLQKADKSAFRTLENKEVYEAKIPEKNNSNDKTVSDRLFHLQQNFKNSNPEPTEYLRIRSEDRIEKKRRKSKKRRTERFYREDTKYSKRSGGYFEGTQEQDQYLPTQVVELEEQRDDQEHR